MSTARYSLVAYVVDVLPAHTSRHGNTTRTIIATEASTPARPFHLLASGRVLVAVDRLKPGDLIAVNGGIAFESTVSVPVPRSAVTLDVGAITILSEVSL